MTVQTTAPTMAPSTSMRAAALEYAERGWRVHPCDWVVKSNDGTWESAQAEYYRSVAKHDGTTVRPVSAPGKLPKLKDWQNLASCDPERIMAFWSKSTKGFPKANIGIATGPESGIFVLDIDGEHGRQSLDALIKENGKLPNTVTVLTHSGGIHYWFTWPLGVDIRNSAGALGSGIDIRGAGGYVVAPPSRGVSGVYAFAPGCSPNEAEVAAAPRWLVEMADAPTRIGAKPQKAKTLRLAPAPHQIEIDSLSSDELLRVPELRKQLDLIGDGDGRKGFDSPINAAACAYFKREGTDADQDVIKGVIRFVVQTAPVKPERTNRDRYSSDDYLDERIANACSFVAKQAAEKAARSRFEFTDEAELVAAMNEGTAVIWDRDRLVVLVDKHGPVRFMKVPDARNAFAPYKLIIANDDKRSGGSTKAIPGFDVWLKSGERREYTDKAFDPSGRVGRGTYNTYQGFTKRPRLGDWSLMQVHLFENVCRGNIASYKALVSWFAQLFQQPERKLGSALVLRGEKGCGKSMVGDWVSQIIGSQHSTKISNPRHLIGNFNAHFAEALLVVLEEGFWAGCHIADGVLKDFITSGTLMVERKGVDAGQVPNYARLLITSNAGRVAPATKGERRFMVFDVSPARAKDQKFFGDLDQQMRQGGAEAMLHDLLRYKFDERLLRDPPQTEGLSDQVIANLRPEERWYFAMLDEGHLPGEPDAAWPENEVLSLPMEELRTSYNVFVPRIGGAEASASVVGKFIREMIPDLPPPRRPKGQGGTRGRHLVLPPLEQLRSRFAEAYRVSFEPVAVSNCEVSWADCPEARSMFLNSPAPLPVNSGPMPTPANDGSVAASAA